MELLIAITVIGIMAALSIPMMLSFIQASQTRGAAQELVVMLNQARQLAITKNSSYSVEVDQAGNQLRFCSGSTTPCPAGTVWTGPGTDGNGWLKLANDAKIACTTPAPKLVFSSLGAATTPGNLKVQNLQGTSNLTVKVSASGRIRTDSTATCP